MFYGIDPVSILEPTEEAIEAAIQGALHVSIKSISTGVPSYEESQQRKSPLLLATKVRSYRAFERDATHCSIYGSESQIDIDAYKPAKSGGGYVPTGETIKHEGLKGAGKIILDLLTARELAPE